MPGRSRRSLCSQAPASAARRPSSLRRLPPGRLGSMLLVLLLGVLAPTGFGFPVPSELQSLGSQCVEHDCFALFRGPATFLAASQTCERLQGHLMTVRSSVAADVISLLLSGNGADSLHFLIGLKLPPGCHDLGRLGPLRGFQWVTGDNDTSYSRWAPSDRAATPLCGPLCVAVSLAGAPAPGEPAWEEQSCTAEAEGFLCEFHFEASCRPLAMEPSAAAVANASNIYSTPFGAHGMDFQALPVGSSASVAALAVELVCAVPQQGAVEARWGRVAAGAWDCRVENGGCEHSCDRSSGSPRCLCPADAALQDDGRSCSTHTEHLCFDLCEHFCVLDFVTDAYTCMCETGYQLAEDKHRCEDVDDCVQDSNPCSPPQDCINTQGGFSCICPNNYELVDGECIEPVDPCFRANCEYQCEHVGYSDYRCICAEGFLPNPLEPHRCQMFCNQTTCPADCDPNNLDSCQCPEGYILDEGSVCTDIDECNNDNCPGECQNFPGGFKCICGPDSALAGQPGTDCDTKEVSDSGSGELPSSLVPSTSPGPLASGPMYSDLLIGISVASLSLVVGILALLCHLRKKQCATLGKLEYKCAASAKDVVL